MNEKQARQIRALGGEGIISPEDLKALRAAKARVALLMNDGLWHSARRIRLAAGVNGREASEGLRRLRELRGLLGVEIEKRRSSFVRSWEYRLMRKPQSHHQQELNYGGR